MQDYHDMVSEVKWSLLTSALALEAQCLDHTLDHSHRLITQVTDVQSDTTPNSQADRCRLVLPRQSDADTFQEDRPLHQIYHIQHTRRRLTLHIRLELHTRATPFVPAVLRLIFLILPLLVFLITQLVFLIFLLPTLLIHIPRAILQHILMVQKFVQRDWRLLLVCAADL